MLGVFIGRFQPMHHGHIAVLGQAASRCAKLLILVGSANSCRSIKNPWTYAERKDMIVKKLRSAGISNYYIQPINDYPYNDPQWISDVRETVESIGSNPTLFGHLKEGNDYLKWFPDWKFQDLQATIHLSATQVREQMFRENHPEMPDTVMKDWRYYEKEKLDFANYPYPETLNFNCGDAVLECQGFIALIQRKNAPGQGTWALPGGFKNRNETFIDTIYRELTEEAGLKVPLKVLRGSLIKTKLYDSPTRSFGIPRNTLAGYIRIAPDPDGRPPKMKARDDALKADWFTLNDALNKMALYDDHKHIISEMTGVMPRPAYVNLG